MIEKDNYEQVVIVAEDGDYYCLTKYLSENGKLKRVLIPDGNNYSAVAKKA